jgi:formylglycine-generating enzyme required for sulfatase activity
VRGFMEKLSLLVLLLVLIAGCGKPGCEADPEMVFIPAGEFIMGNNAGNDAEKPERKVFLDAFCIDKYEVTNAQYKKCVDAGVCNPPARPSSPAAFSTMAIQSLTTTLLFGSLGTMRRPIANGEANGCRLRRNGRRQRGGRTDGYGLGEIASRMEAKRICAM